MSRGNAPKTCVKLVSKNGTVINKEWCRSWKAIREAVRGFIEKKNEYPENNWVVTAE